MRTCPKVNAPLALSVRAEVRIPIRNGYLADFVTFNWPSAVPEHFALRFDSPGDTTAIPLVRLHSECVTGDVFGSMRCDCGAQLDQALDVLHRQGGMLLYLRQEGRGIGLAAKLDAYRLQDNGLDTYAANEALSLPADGRCYEIGAAMLLAMGVGKIRLLTNNPDNAAQLRDAGIAIASVVPTGTFLTDFNQAYLEAKMKLAGHTLQARKVS